MAEKEYLVYGARGEKISGLVTDVYMSRWYGACKSRSETPETRVFKPRGLEIFTPDINGSDQAKIKFTGDEERIQEEIDILRRKFGFVLREVRN